MEKYLLASRLSKPQNFFSLLLSRFQLPLCSSFSLSLSLSLSSSQLPLFLSLTPVVTARLVTPVTTGISLARSVRRRTFRASLVTLVTTGNQVILEILGLCLGFRKLIFRSWWICSCICEIVVGHYSHNWWVVVWIVIVIVIFALILFTYSFNNLMVMLIYWEMLVLLRSKKKAKQKS